MFRNAIECLVSCGQEKKRHLKMTAVNPVCIKGKRTRRNRKGIRSRSDLLAVLIHTRSLTCAP